MNEQIIPSSLKDLPVPAIRYYDTIGSTNDEALNWANNGAPDGALVVADLQTNGRGRMGRRWVTHPGSSLAFSMICHPDPGTDITLSFYSPLGALAVCQALTTHYGLDTEVKWPNDVLIERQKVAGVLAEASWLGEKIQHIIIGIGINVTRDAVPAKEDLQFPATSVEGALGRTTDRFELLAAVLESINYWRQHLAVNEFIQAWQSCLAFKGEWVNILHSDHKAFLYGKLVGIDTNGNLRLHTNDGKEQLLSIGDIHLRPAEDELSTNPGG